MYVTKFEHSMVKRFFLKNFFIMLSFMIVVLFFLGMLPKKIPHALHLTYLIDSLIYFIYDFFLTILR